MMKKIVLIMAALSLCGRFIRRTLLLNQNRSMA